MVSRTSTGQFQKGGVSPNKLGRPKGSSQRMILFKALIQPNSEAIINTAVTMALQGNEAMLRLLLAHILPAKPTDDHTSIKFPNLELNDTTSLQKWGETVLEAVANASITPSEGKNLMCLIEAQLNLISKDHETDKTLSEEMKKLREELEKKYSKEY